MSDTNDAQVRARDDAVAAITKALDEMVADEGIAMSALAVALGRRVAAYAKSERGLSHLLLRVNNHTSDTAVRTFGGAPRANGGDGA